MTVPRSCSKHLGMCTIYGKKCVGIVHTHLDNKDSSTTLVHCSLTGFYMMMMKYWDREPERRLRFEAIEWQLEEFFISRCFEDRTYIAPSQTKHK